jgi:hypothetical protein
MGKLLKLPTGRKAVKKAGRSKGLFEDIGDPILRAAFMTLYENDQRLAKAAKLNLMEVLTRLENLEAIVFAQSVLIADLRGKPLTTRQRAKISQVLKIQGKRPSP